MTPWRRTLTITASSQVLSILGFNFVTPFTPLFVQDLGVHGVSRVTLWAGILAGGAALSMAIFAPIWGVLSDRHGRKIMVVRATLSAMVIIALMSLAQNVWQLLILRLLQGAFTGTVSASQALVASQTPRDQLGFSLGVMQTALYVGTSLGPFAGGLIAEAVGFRISFLFGALSLLLAGLLVAFGVQEQHETQTTVRNERQGMIAGMRESWAIPALAPMIAAYFGVNFGTTIVFPILPQFVQMLQGAAGHAAAASGLMFAAAGVAGAVAAVSTGYISDRIGFRSVLVIASVVAAVFTLPQAFVTSTWELLVLRILVGLAMGAVMPSASALIASLVPPEKRGTAYGLAGSANSLGFGLGPLTAAGVVSVTSIRAVFVVGALVMMAIATWVALMVRVPDEPDDVWSSHVPGVAPVSLVTAPAEPAEAGKAGSQDRT